MQPMPKRIRLTAVLVLLIFVAGAVALYFRNASIPTATVEDWNPPQNTLQFPVRALYGF